MYTFGFQNRNMSEFGFGVPLGSSHHPPSNLPTYNTTPFNPQEHEPLNVTPARQLQYGQIFNWTSFQDSLTSLNITMSILFLILAING